MNDAETSAVLESGPEMQELKQRLSQRSSLLLPLVLMLALSGLLWIQIQRQAEDARWVNHTDEVLTNVSRLKGDIVDQETALRGFLLTEDRLFLEPFQKANPPLVMDEIAKQVSDNRAQLDRLAAIRQRFDYWQKERATVVIDTPSRARGIEAMKEGKREMDDIRASLDAFSEAEIELRRARSDASAASVAQTRASFAVLALIAAGILAWTSRRKLTAVASTYDRILRRERDARRATEREQWVRAGQSKVAEAMLGELSQEKLAKDALTTLSEYVDAAVGTLYVAGVNGWTRAATVGLDDADVPRELAHGEGLIGRATNGKASIRVTDVPAKHLRLKSGIAEGSSTEIAVVPAIADGTVHAVLELGFLRSPHGALGDLLDRVGESIGIAVRSEGYRRRLRELLEESQQQTEELQTQQEELRASNEELEQQSAALREVHQALEERQKEAEDLNAKLEERAVALAESREAFREKAEEADRASKFKSEFLANMSHELRTPLNSTLILAKLLGENKTGNLTEEQVRFANTIYSSGNDLLTLINDILDLSKVEAGHAEVNIQDTPLAMLVQRIERVFDPIAKQKPIAFKVDFAAGAPDKLLTDPQRVEQILKNLLSNAFKFTERGEVTLRISRADSHVTFAVTDSGIGIAQDQLAAIFEPFRQADGTTNRKYGGTGLGLSISRELAILLDGTLTVHSEPGKGSTFELTLPLMPSVKREQPNGKIIEVHSQHTNGSGFQDLPIRGHDGARTKHTAPPESPRRAEFPDDRDELADAKARLLVVEDDVAFARIVYDLAHDRGLSCVVAHDARSGLELARRVLPNAIVLDLNLPDRTGLFVLDQLKHDPALRRVPVHVVSVADYAEQALSMGAVGFLRKPVELDALAGALGRLESNMDRRMKRLLIVEDDPAHRESLMKLLAGANVEIVGAATAGEALAALKEHTFDCVVTDVGLPDATGFDLISRMASDEAFAFPPVIVYTGRALTADEEQALRKYSSAIIVKGAQSIDRLVDEVSLFLREVEGEPVDRSLRARDREAVLDGKTILVAEDDVRNVFALSKILEPKGAKVLIARNGREAISTLEDHPDVSLVLMDIMMPEMDGLAATRAIRQRREWARLPIIALTAKTMPDDRENCLRAGANDYAPKPIDVEMLLSHPRVDAAMSNLSHGLDEEIKDLLQAMYETRHYDFRHYAPASLRRRISLAVAQLGCESVNVLRRKVTSDDTAFAALVQILTVQVSDMFRDPPFFKRFRDEIVPELRSYPSVKLWVAGCGAGEEVYSITIMLAEEGLLDRALVYATDISADALEKARAGIFSLDRVAGFSANYFEAGGKESLAKYYRTGYGGAVFDRALTANVVFADHSLATDAVFAEVQVVTCRNVLIYFDRELQNRATGLFHDALCRRGFLGLGSRESLRFTTNVGAFRQLSLQDTWYQRC